MQNQVTIKLTQRTKGTEVEATSSGDATDVAWIEALCEAYLDAIELVRHIPGYAEERPTAEVDAESKRRRGFAIARGRAARTDKG